MSRGVAVLAGPAGLLGGALLWGAAVAGAHPVLPARQATLVHIGRVAMARPLVPALGTSVWEARTARSAGLALRPAQGRPKAHLKASPTSLTYRGGRFALKWSSSGATRCVLSASPRFWSGANPARVPCRGRFSTTIPAVAVGGHWRFTFRAKNAKGAAAVVRRTFVLRAPPFAISANWAGYIVPSTDPVTQISGQFTVPTLDCSKTPNAGMSTWAGVGGAGGSSGDLLQTGVRSDCVGGVQHDVGWWEEVPGYYETPFNGLAISAGHAMRATVGQNSDGSWTTRIDDLTLGVSGVMTTGQTYGTILDSNPVLQVEGTGAVSYAGGRTAEWIVEDYLLNNALVPLADFRTVAFTNLTTSLPSWALTGGERSGIGDRNGLLHAAPSAPDSSGRGFRVTWTG